MSTSDLESLRGSCSCGRNQYFIHIPDDVADHARIYFDDSSDNRTTIPTRVKFLFFFFFFCLFCIRWIYANCLSYRVQADFTELH